MALAEEKDDLKLTYCFLDVRNVERTLGWGWGVDRDIYLNKHCTLFDGIHNTRFELTLYPLVSV